MNAVIWDITLCGSCKNLHFGGTIDSSEMQVLTRARWRQIPKDDIFHSHRQENLKSYKVLTGLTPWQTCNMFLARYELGSYISEDGILHSHHRENLKYYVALTGWGL
jgi:hypothetical protein